MKKILLTGFEPFQKETINPSRLIVESLNGLPGVDTLVLPVSYKRSFEELRKSLYGKNYDYVLMLGQAGGRKTIDLERVAINLQDSEHPDEDGDLKIQSKISAEGPDAFLSRLSLRDVSAALQSKGYPVAVSFSAGAFVCNSVYYQAFEHLKKAESSTQILFIHVPYINEQLEGKAPGTPSLEFQLIKNAISELIKII